MKTVDVGSAGDLLHPTPVHRRYTEFEPAPALHGVVECLWTRAASAPWESPRERRVLPDGCVDVVIDLRAGPGRGVATPLPGSALLVGAMTRPLVLRDSRPGDFLGARLRPGHALALLGVPASELTDLRIPVEELWPEATELRERVVAAGPDGWRAVLEHALAQRLARADQPPHDVIAAVRLVFTSRGRLAVDALAATLGVTRQHLARQFARHVGVTPKMLCRVARVQYVLRQAARRDGDWSAIAFAAGYCDQSHLVNDFGELTGLTPERWLASR